MCKTWVQIVSNNVFRQIVMSIVVFKVAGSVHKLASYTKVVRYLYIVCTSKISANLNLLNGSLYTLSTPLIITKSFLNNLFFITNNLGVKV